MTDTIPLIFDGDSFSIEVEDETVCIRLLHVQRYDGNKNIIPVAERFFDLEPRVREAVLRQIGRRYPQKTIRVQ